MMQENITERCLDALKCYDEWTYQHSIRVQQYSIKIGVALGLDKKLMESLKKASLLHDIGKLAIPNFILDKPGKLTEQEYAVIKQHTRIGCMLLRLFGVYPEEVCCAVRDHHERCDGHGYDNRTDFSLLAKIICVADSFDAMSEKRPYKHAKSKEEIINDLENNAGYQFDPNISKIAANLFCL